MASDASAANGESAKYVGLAMRRKVTVLAAVISALLLVAGGRVVWMRVSAVPHSTSVALSGEGPAAASKRLDGSDAPKATSQPSDARVQNGREVPRSWIKGGRGEAAYELLTDHRTVWHGSSSALLRSTRAVDASEFGAIMQRTKAADFAGQRVSFSAFLASEGARDGGSLWFRAEDEKGRVLTFDNLGGRAVVASTSWRQYSIVIDVPKEATTLIYGAVLQGTGTLWMDTARLVVIDKDTPTTATPTRSSQDKPNSPVDPAAVPSNPENLDFEETQLTDHPEVAADSEGVARHNMLAALTASASGKCAESIMAQSLLNACEKQVVGNQQLLAPLGQIKGATLLSVRDGANGSGPLESYSVKFEHGDMVWNASVDNQGKLRVLWSRGEVAHNR